MTSLPNFQPNVLDTYIDPAMVDLPPPIHVPFAKLSAEAEGEDIASRLNQIKAPEQVQESVYDNAFKGASHQILDVYGVVSDDQAEFDSAYSYAQAEDETLHSDRLDDLFEAYESHPAMLAINGLDRALTHRLKKHTPRLRRMTLLLLEAYDSE